MLTAHAQLPTELRLMALGLPVHEIAPMEKNPFRTFWTLRPRPAQLLKLLPPSH